MIYGISLIVTLLALLCWQMFGFIKIVVELNEHARYIDLQFRAFNSGCRSTDHLTYEQERALWRPETVDLGTWWYLGDRIYKWYAHEEARRKERGRE